MPKWTCHSISFSQLNLQARPGVSVDTSFGGHVLLIPWLLWIILKALILDILDAVVFVLDILKELGISLLQCH